MGAVAAPRAWDRASPAPRRPHEPRKTRLSARVRAGRRARGLRAAFPASRRSSFASFTWATRHASPDGPFCADERGIACRTTCSHKALKLSDGRANRGQVAVSRDGAFVRRPTVVGDRGKRRFGLRLRSCLAVRRRRAGNGPVGCDNNRLRPRGTQVLSGMHCGHGACPLFCARRIALTRPQFAAGLMQRCHAAPAARERQHGGDRQGSRSAEHWRSLLCRRIPIGYRSAGDFRQSFRQTLLGLFTNRIAPPELERGRAIEAGERADSEPRETRKLKD
jgi:hypothetical protein